jgi:uncharacterized protein YodC (DUF2158 family)
VIATKTNFILERSRFEMSNEFNAGDVVQLKSGGPKMTVSTVGQFSGEIKARCDWFEGTTPKYAMFPLTSLKKVE